ncbi:MAG TPA: MlaD family protein [Bacillota bacterium]
MGVNPETKVGIFTAGALVALLSLFFWLNRVTFMQKGSEIDIVFERIDGLRPGAPVKYVGVDVGRISSIFFEGNQIIVRVHINQGFKVPLTSKAFIASAGVVGDKYLDLHPLKAGEQPLPGNRIRGQTPASLEEFYSTTYEVMNTVKQTVDSLNKLLADPALAASIKNSLANMEQLTATANQLINHNQAALNTLVRNTALASAELARASATVNQFLNGIAANGQTAADLQEILIHIKSVSTNLDKFTAILADNGCEISTLADDAHQTMGAISGAAQSVTKAVDAVSSGQGNAANLKQIIGQAANAAKKVSVLVNNFEKMSLHNQAGLSYRSADAADELTANYQLDLNFDEQKAIRFSWEDIGHDNLATLQYNFKKPAFHTRVGLYRNRVGVGLDLKTPFNHTLGIDLWDTRDTNLGLTSDWKLNDYWSMRLGASSELEDPDTLWNVGLWRKF